VARRIADHLAKLIADGLLVSGEKLPGETLLARRLGVSRPTLREALGVLEARGLVEVRPRSGTYVASAVADREVSAVAELAAVDPEKLFELVEIRKVVDPAAAALAARNRGPADVERFHALRDAARDLAGEDLVRHREGGRLYAGFFRTLAQATGNTLFAHLVEWVGRAIEDALPSSRARLAGRPEVAVRFRAQLEAILDAVEAGDADRARQSTTDHLEDLDRTLRRAPS
jgi:GntR family transcriptional repressor for pyruvate dehydrogenase complex